MPGRAAVTRQRPPGARDPECIVRRVDEAGYLAGNPLARRRRAPTQARITRYLSHDLWETVKDTVAAMPTETARERLHAARCRWVLTVLYLGGLRAAEWTATTMGAFFCRRDAEGSSVGGWR
ncbi:hypothetical protein N234_37375 [Ralstonia pickettii DTP0602]|nr:hypothetical protein N234_37375 [Ralstonia pickettii DTP0602]